MRIFSLSLIVFVGMFFVLPSFTNAATIVKPPNNLGIVGWWPLNEGTSTIAHDISGYGNNGTLQTFSAPSTATSGWTSGKRAGALMFDGTSDYVSTSLSRSSYSSISVTLWYRFDGSVSDTYNALIAGQSADFFIGKNSGNSNIGVQEGGYNGSIAVGTNAWDGNWHHMVYTFSGGTGTVYLDGRSVGLGAFAGGTGAIWIGRENEGGGYSFKGKIDDVRIYDRAISPTEITTLYRSGEVTRKNVSDSGLLGHWSMDEGTSTIAHDFSGNSYNGTLTNMAVPSTATSGWTTGKRGMRTLAFDGSNDYVPASNSTGAHSTTALTVSGWVYYSDLAGRTIASKWGNVATSDYSWLLFTNWFSGGRIDFLVSGNGTGYVAASSPAGSVTTGRWYYVSGVYDGSTVKLYIDGVLVNTNSTGVPASLKASAAPITIGADYDNGGAVFRFFRGKLDDVRIYNRALSAIEIMGLYNQDSLTVNRSQNNAITNGLVGMWSFNGVDMNWTSSSAGIAYDRSGNGNTGTLTNMNQSTSPVSGRVGQALSFDGADDYIISVNNLGISGNAEFTMCSWIKWSGVWSSDFPSFMGNNSTGVTNQGLSFTVQSGRPAIDFWSNRFRATSALSTDTWYHICGTKTPGAISLTSKIYVNGTLVSGAFEGSDTTPNITAAPAVIGRLDATRWFRGNIDESRMYNRALSSAEIKQLYLMGK